MQRARFHSMTEGTAEDWAIIDAAEVYNMRGVAGRVLVQLDRLSEGRQPFAVTRYQHSLQAATRALRDDAEPEMVVAALLHDIGDDLAVYNHAKYAAAVLEPYVSKRTHWIVEKHDVFQGYYFWHYLGRDRNARDAYRDHPWFDDCAAFCAEWDQNAFDPGYASEPIEVFAPMVEQIFSRTPYGEHYV
jgi:predicted HD phosphohydrolase